jgi:hypothetical protein
VEQVVGEFLADGYIGRNAPIEKIMGKFSDDRRDRLGEGREVVENNYPHLQVDTGSPGEGIMGGADDEQQRRGQNGEKTRHMVTA